MLAPAINLFCRVVDNFGDVGVCLRLARQCRREHGARVALWVDDMACLKKFMPSINVALTHQSCEGIDIWPWPKDEDWPALIHHPHFFIGTAVIEAFACTLPEPFVAIFANCARPPIWINLDYLSAEEWVQSCHTKPSPQSGIAHLVHKFFYFPGFTPATGGLIRESFLPAPCITSRRDRYNTLSAFLSAINVPLAPIDRLFHRPYTTLSLLAYGKLSGHARSDSWRTLLSAWASMPDHPLLVLIPVDSPPALQKEFQDFFEGMDWRAGAHGAREHLQCLVLPWLSQEDYDRLLRACDINWVRGEDSLVRAIWAARPFVWQLYSQEPEVLKKKHQAFWHTMDALVRTNTDNADNANTHSEQHSGEAHENNFSQAWVARGAIEHCSLAINGLVDKINWSAVWSAVFQQLMNAEKYNERLAKTLARQQDLATQLIGFIDRQYHRQ